MTSASLTTVLEVKNLKYGYLSGEANLLIKDLSFKINSSQFVALIGANGAGKTTLLKLILGLLKPVSGQISYFQNLSVGQATKQNLIGYVPQHLSLDSVFPATVRELLINSPGATLAKLNIILEEIDIANLLHKNFSLLSGGQKQLVLLAKSLISQPKLLILDELTAGVDVENQVEVYSLLKSLVSKRNISVFMCTHDLESVAVKADRVLCLHKADYEFEGDEVNSATLKAKIEHLHV